MDNYTLILRAGVLTLLKGLNFKFDGRGVKFERRNPSVEDVKF
ncbi:hypothetical protein [Campylobacter showae]|nr:hypothetical protein [Campylobacter showae]